MPGEEDEWINQGIYGKSFGLYLRDALQPYGYLVPRVVCEDWGWWVCVEKANFSSGLGIYGLRLGDTPDLDLCVTVLTPRGKRWSWGQFRFNDHTAEVDQLHQTIRRICDADPEITVIGESLEFPFG